MKDYAYSSIFREEIYQFLELRKASNYKDKNVHILQYLDKYLVDNGINTKELSENVLSSWLNTKKDQITPATLDHYISYINKFASYLNDIGYKAFQMENVLYSDSYVPYIFTIEEINSLFQAADSMRFGNKLSRFQFPMLLRILYGCGLRLSEALKIRVDDINVSDGVIIIRNAKNNRDRITPIDESLVSILKAYCSLIPFTYSTNPLIFENEKGELRNQCWAKSLFSKLLRSLGYDRKTLKPHERGICLHCFRHTFAITSLRQQEQNGVDNYDAIPILSIYLGHVRLRETERYLHMTDETASDILDTMNQYMPNIFPEVPK